NRGLERLLVSRRPDQESRGRALPRRLALELRRLEMKLGSDRLPVGLAGQHGRQPIDQPLAQPRIEARIGRPWDIEVGREGGEVSAIRVPQEASGQLPKAFANLRLGRVAKVHALDL